MSDLDERNVLNIIVNLPLLFMCYGVKNRTASMHISKREDKNKLFAEFNSFAQSCLNLIQNTGGTALLSNIGPTKILVEILSSAIGTLIQCMFGNALFDQ